MYRRALLLLSFLLPANALALDDPMRPPQAVTRSAATRVEPGFSLSSTFIGAQERRAVINGKTVRIGDRIAGARVETIEPTQVRLQRGGSEILVRLLPTRVKQPATAVKQEE